MRNAHPWYTSVQPLQFNLRHYPTACGVSVPLHPRNLEELERQGTASIRALLSDSYYTGLRRGAPVLLLVSGVDPPSRADVEEWLLTKNDSEPATTDRIQRRTPRSTIITAVATILALVVPI